MTTNGSVKSLFFDDSAGVRQRSYQVLDVQSVTTSGVKDEAVKGYGLSSCPTIIKTDLLIAGGGMGGSAAALTALSADDNIRVVLTEETSWLGGQMTSQGVSALDENKWVETTGACQSYIAMRQSMREHYQAMPGIVASAKSDKRLNPGLCWVTRLSFEPSLGLATLNALLAPFIKTGRLTVLLRSKAVDALTENSQGEQKQQGCQKQQGSQEQQGRQEQQAQRKQQGQHNRIISAVLFAELDKPNHFTEIQSAHVIDATELGDLFALAKAPYFTGSDDKSRTGEAHAPATGNPDNVQDFTYPFVLTYHPGQNHTIAKPAGYDDFHKQGKFSLFGFKMFEEYDGTCPVTGKPKHFLPFWTYRRLIAAELFDSTYPFDLSMINWDANDLRGYNIIDVSPEVAYKALQLAKQVSLGFLYWLQTEAPRDDGGKGYPELKLDYELMGTADGLSIYPYIREARRLDACKIVVEEDVVISKNPEARAALYADSVGIGHYPVDIHGLQEIPDTAQETKPFQIPYGALVTDSFSNLLAGCKNIGVTHITNGAYRLHPIEWAIGTACGAAVAISRKTGVAVNRFLQDQPGPLTELQLQLLKFGAPIFWFDDVAPGHPHYVAIHYLAALGILPYDKNSLSFYPDQKYPAEMLEQLKSHADQDFSDMTRSEVAAALLESIKSPLRC